MQTATSGGTNGGGSGDGLFHELQPIRTAPLTLANIHLEKSVQFISRFKLAGLRTVDQCQMFSTSQADYGPATGSGDWRLDAHRP